MQRDTTITVVAVLVTMVLANIGGFGYWYFTHSNNKPAVLASSSASQADSGGSSGSSLSISQPCDTPGVQSQQTSNGAQDGVSLQDNTCKSNSSSQSTSSSQAKQAPGPESFAQYDQYKDGTGGLFGDIIVGNGGEATGSSKVAVTYQGWLTNGKLFDQSTDKAISFTLGKHEVIPGWEQTILGMKVGGKRRLVIPPAVGYGSQGKPPQIPPNAVMVFDVELVAVE